MTISSVFLFLQKCLKFCMSFSIEYKNIILYFSAGLLFVFKILRMQKNLCLLSRQHMTTKAVISFKIQKNIDLLQHAKNFYSRHNCCHGNGMTAVILFLLWYTFLVPSFKNTALIFPEKPVKILISRKHVIAKMLISPKLEPNVNFTQWTRLDNVDFRSFRSVKIFDSTVSCHHKDFDFTFSEKFISCNMYMYAQFCWFQHKST